MSANDVYDLEYLYASQETIQPRKIQKLENKKCFHCNCESDSNSNFCCNCGKSLVHNRKLKQQNMYITKEYID